MARSNVPKFGNWENEGNVPYTVYFDKARRNRGGKMINPNDPQENPELFANMGPLPPPAPVRSSKPRAKPEDPPARMAVRAGMELRDRKEDTEYRQFSSSPAQNDGGRGQRPGRSPMPSAGSDHSFDRSPLHQVKVTGRGGGGSPLWEGKNNEGSNGMPGRSRLRPATRGDDGFDKGTAVPRFGEWNNNPESAENFTHMFEKVREERKNVPGNASATPKHSSYHPTPPRPSNKSKKCCFGFW